MRRRIVDAILESLTSGDNRRALAAAELLESAVHGPVGLLNRNPRTQNELTGRRSSSIR